MGASPTQPGARARGAASASAAERRREEERDRRSLADIVAQEKSLLRACEALQKQADALQAALVELKRGKKRMDTPIVAAKVEELALKHRLIQEHASTLKTLRALRCDLEVALSGRKLQALVLTTKERVQEMAGRDPAQVLRDISDEENRLLDQERILEEALNNEMDNEEGGRERDNEAGAWNGGGCGARARARARRARTHPALPLATAHARGFPAPCRGVHCARGDCSAARAARRELACAAARAQGARRRVLKARGGPHQERRHQGLQLVR